MNGWTPERKMRQAQLIQSWRPWEKSTGAKTVKGKRIVSRNAWKGGARPAMRLVFRAASEEARRVEMTLIQLSTSSGFKVHRRLLRQFAFDLSVDLSEIESAIKQMMSP